ncbi:hypothetical protein INS49_005876 [Diaporthe citri]|uniref:uncharacterized protein n=1 Tax=Diaporthe citri TaxID=83186 RepID=UPI001C81993B|nr:uncharacterized protein INS49_005876 [Diaporthe citri]KAG6364277.1 hypothetical protein INS49_005876 [Diaporthe citri]
MHSACLITAGLSLLSAVAAQTSTECNPTEKTCGADQGLSQASYSVDFTKGASDDWNITYGALTYDDTNGAVYTISKPGDAPTVQSNFYVFFGVVSVVMKAAPGTGIVSSAILESDDLDEIDWEWLGGTATEMADSQADFHNYTIVWTKESTIWMIDGQSVRTLAYADANGGSNYPQTPMRVKLGTWAGGDPSNPEGTIQWAGGETNYDDGPFTAYIQSVSITNYNPANSYTYGDLTGSYESIVLGDTDVNTTTSSGSTGSDSSADDGSAPTSPVAASNASGTATVRPSATGGASGISGSAPYSNGSSSTRPGASSATNGTGSSSPTSPSSGGSDGSDGSSSSSSSSSSASGSSTAAAEASAAKLTASKAGSSVLLGVVGCALALI